MCSKAWNILLWIVLVAGGLNHAALAGSESFTALDASGSTYVSGSYSGDGGLTWTYNGTRSVTATYNITGKSAGFGTSGTRNIYTTVSSGVGDVTYKTRSYFTGGSASDRTIEVWVDGSLRESYTLPAMGTVYTRTVSGINAAGSVVLEFRSTGSRQIVVDDVSWTDYSASQPTQWTLLQDRGTPRVTYYLGDTMSTQFMFAINTDTTGWTVDYGVGTTTDGSGWTWSSATYDSTSGSDRYWRAGSGSPTFTSVGTWYYAGRFITGSYTYYAFSDWTSVNDTLSASSYFTVSAINNPGSQTATRDGGNPTSEIDLSWSKNAQNHNVMVVRKLSTDSWTEPTQGTSYSATDSIGSGTVVYNGSATSASAAGLTAGAEYDFKFYSVNNDYYSPGVTASATTRASEPASAPTSLDITAADQTGMTITWSGVSTQVLVAIRADSDLSAHPADDTTYTADADFGGSGSSLGGGKVVYKGNGTSVNVTGLAAGTLYYIRVYNFNGGAGTENYRVSTYLSGSQATCSGAPTTTAATAISGDQFTANWGTVIGATGYQLDVATNDAFSVGGGGGIQLGESFDSGLAASYTTGNQTLTSGVWYTDGVIQEASSASRGGVGGAARLNDDTAGVHLRTPALNTVGYVTFWYRELNSGGGSFTLEKSYDGSNWSTVDTQSFSGATYVQYSNDVNDAATTIYLRIVNDNNPGHLILDDFEVSELASGGGDFIDGYQSREVGNTGSFAVTGLTAGITYYYRVRATNEFCVGGDSSTTAVTTVAGVYSTLTSQGFEGDGSEGWNYVLVPNGAELYVDGATNASGNYALTFRGADSLNADPYIEFDTIDLGGYAAVTLEVAFAVAGADAGDDLELDLSYDGGTTWAGAGSATLVSGANNTNLGFGGTGASTVGANPYRVGIPGTESQVKVRIRFDESINDNTFDRYFIDDIRLTGSGSGPVISLENDFFVTAETNAALTIPVTISAAADATVQVALAGTALAGGTDYSLSTTSVVFSSSGGTTINLTLTPADDLVAEGLEEVGLRLVNASGAVVGGPAVAAVLIQDDEAFSVMAANLTGGTNFVNGSYTYDETAQRLIRRLQPDILAIQEWKFTNVSARAFVDSVLGTNYHFYIEPESDGFPIPNGVISRWPITASNEWADSYVGSRDHVHVTIDLPGPRNLNVVSTHFKAGTNAAEALTRVDQARELTNYIANAALSSNDYLVIAGDLNITGRTETAFLVLTQLVSDAHQPGDQQGNLNSSIGRVRPYDHVLPGDLLEAEHQAITFAGFTYADGAIFVTRDFDDHPLPARVEDSFVPNRAHHAVIKLFSLATGAIPPAVSTAIASATNQTTATAGGDVTDDGGSAVTNRGVVWSVSANPTVPGSQTTNGTGAGAFTATLVGLTPGATYAYRAFAQNAAGTGYGAEYSLTTPCFGAPTGLVISVTNDTGFTAVWSNVVGAAGYAVDVSTNAAFGGVASNLLYAENFSDAALDGKGIYGDSGSGVTTNMGGVTNFVVDAPGSAFTSDSSLNSFVVEAGAFLSDDVDGVGTWRSRSLAVGSVTSVNLSLYFQVRGSGDNAAADFGFEWGYELDGGAFVKVNDIGDEAGEESQAALDNTILSSNGVVLAGATGLVVRVDMGANGSGDGFAFDDVTVSGFGAGGGPDFVAGYSNRGVTAAGVSVTGLTGGVTYHVRVRATNDVCASGPSDVADVTTILLAPDLSVSGNGVDISNGDTIPDVADHTGFGTVGLVNDSLVRTFTITNSGNAALTLSTVTVGGTHAADFGVTDQPDFSVAAGASTTFQVTFNPSAVGARSATVYMTNNVAGENPYTFAIEGTGEAAEFATGPASISLTTMVGTPVAAQNVGVTNAGSGDLVYTVTTNAAWLTVAPQDYTLGASAAQQHSVAIDIDGLYAGVSNAVITFADANAGNSPVTVPVTLTLTNIPNPTAVSATADGNELVRLAWTKPATHDVLIAYRLGSAPGVPANGTAYAVDAALPGGGTVIYKGSAASLEHVVRTNATHFYSFHAIHNNHYSPGVSDTALTGPYDAGEIVEPVAYTNGYSLVGANGGNGWSGAWTVGSGTWTAETSSLSYKTNYPAAAANRIRVADPGNGGKPYATRSFPGVTSGTIYFGAVVSYQYQGPWKFAGFSVMSNTTEKVFVGKIPNAENNRFGLTSARTATDYRTSGVTLGDFNTSTGNVYVMIGAYDFATRVFKARAYARTAGIPEIEPVTWDVTTNLPVNALNRIDGIRLASGALGAPDGSIGQTLFDEIRVAPTWNELVKVVADPEIGVLGTNFSVMNTVNTPAAANGTEFGVTVVAGGTVDRTFSITNSGNASLTVTGITTSGLHAADFVVLQPIALPMSVLAGTASNLVVRFDPTAGGTRTAAVTVASSDADNPSYVFYVRGTGGVAPTVTTTIANPTNATTAVAGGNVTAEGFLPVTNRGVVWATTANPTVPGAQTTNGAGAGAFSATLTNLVSGETYFYRAFAQNSAGTSYGAEYTLVTPCFSGTVTGLYASATNQTSFTAAWSNVIGATGYELDVATNAAFDGVGGSSLQTNLFEDFETDGNGTRYATSVAEFSDGDGDYFGRVAADGLSVGASVNLGNIQGTDWFGGQDQDGEGGPASVSLTFSGISISGQTGLTFSAYFAEDDDGTNQDWDGADYLHVEFRVDGGSWSNLIWFEADTTGTNGEPLEDTDFDGLGDGTALTDSFTLFTKAIPATGSTLDLRFSANFDSGDEDWAIDDVKVTGHSSSTAPAFVPGYSNRVVSGTSVTVTGLTGEVTYYFRVRATNEYCATDHSTTATVTTLPSPPGVPADVSASDGTSLTAVDVTWSDVASEQGYRVWRHTANVFGSASPVGATAANATNYSDATATPGQLYYYWVTATNIVGSSGAGFSDSGYRGLAAVTGLAATDIDNTNNTRIVVTWTDIAGETGYGIWRNTVNASNTATYVGAAAADATGFADTTAASDTTYYYWVRGTNNTSASQGEWSASAAGYAGLRAPDALAAAADGIDSIDLTFTPNGEGSQVIIVYDLDNTFTTPSGPAPSVGASFAGGTVVYKGSVSPQTHGSLLACTPYYYQAWSFEGSLYSLTGTTASATTEAPAAPTGLYVNPTNANNFTVHWSPSAGASGYRIDVSTNGTFGSAGALRAQGFEGAMGDTWGFVTAGSVATSSTRARTGTYSLRLDGTGDAVVTFDPVPLSGTAASTVTVAFSASGPDSGDDLYLSVVTYAGGVPSSNTVKLVDGYSNADVAFDATNASDPTTVSPNPYAVAVSATATQVHLVVYGEGLESGDYYYIDDVSLSGTVGGFVPGYEDRAVAGTSVSVTGLLQNTEYFYRVRAEGSVGCTGDNSTTGSVTTITSPIIGLSTNALDFGSVAVGVPSNLTLVVTNSGSAAVVVSSIGVAGTCVGAFAVDPTAFTVPPGAASNVLVTFTPAVTGACSVTLTVNNNTPGDTAPTVTAVGTGYDPASILAPISVVASDDGPEMNVLSWNKGATPNVIVLQSTNAITVTNLTNGLTYAVGSSVPGDAVVAYHGSADGVEIIVPQESSYYYRFFGGAGTVYSTNYIDPAGLPVETFKYETGEIIDQFAYTNNKTLAENNLATGQGWSGGWTGDTNKYLVIDTNLLHGATDYPDPRANKIFWQDTSTATADDAQVTRLLDGSLGGRMFVAFMMNYQYDGTEKYVGLSLMSGANADTEEIFFGKVYSSIKAAGIEDPGASVTTTASYDLEPGHGNDYMIVGELYPAQKTVRMWAFYQGGGPIPQDYTNATPVAVYSNNSLSVAAITGIRLSAGSSGTPGKELGHVYFDEVRVGDTWDEVLNFNYPKVFDYQVGTVIGGTNYVTDGELVETGKTFDISYTLYHRSGITNASFTILDEATGTSLYPTNIGLAFGFDLAAGRQRYTNAVTNRLDVGDVELGVYTSRVYMTAVSGRATNAIVVAETGGAADLFFGEFGEGNDWDKYVEIYNGTGGAIDLSQYLLASQTTPGDKYTVWDHWSQLAPSTYWLDHNETVVLLNGGLIGGIAATETANAAMTNALISAGRPYLFTSNNVLQVSGDDPVALFHVSDTNAWIDVCGIGPSVARYIMRRVEDAEVPRPYPLQVATNEWDYRDWESDRPTGYTNFLATAGVYDRNVGLGGFITFQVIDDDDQAPVAGAMAVTLGGDPVPETLTDPLLLAGWNFNLANLVAGHGSGTLTVGLPNYDFTTTGSGLNLVEGDTNGLPLRVNGSSNNGTSFTFQVSMSDHEDLVMTFAAERSSAGHNNNQVSWSTNGTAFTDFGAPFDPTTAYTLQTFDFSSVTELDGAAAVYIRITVDGATASGVSRFDNIQFKARRWVYAFTDGLLAAVDGVNPLHLGFEAHDTGSGVPRGAAANGTNMNVTVPGVMTNDTSRYQAGLSSATATGAASTSVWAFTSFTPDQIGGLFGNGSNFVPVSATLADADFDRPDDTLWLSNRVFGTLHVTDDDPTAPEAVNVNLPGAAAAPFVVVSNGIAPSDPIRGFISRRTGSGTNIVTSVTDEELALAGSRNLQFVFGARDELGLVSRGTAGTTNEVMSIKLGDALAANIANYNGTLSSPQASTNTLTTNVWTFADGDFSGADITALVNAGQQAVRVTIPDNDNDRPNDRATLYSAQVGYLSVIDDDIRGPVIGSLVAENAYGTNTTLYTGFETNEFWPVGSLSSAALWTNVAANGTWFGYGVTYGTLDPKISGVRRIGLLTNSLAEPWLQLPPVVDPGSVVLFAGRFSGNDVTLRVERADGASWVSLGGRTVTNLNPEFEMFTWDVDVTGVVTLRVAHAGTGPQVYIDDITVLPRAQWLSTNSLSLAWTAAVDDYSGVEEYRVIAPGVGVVTPSSASDGDPVSAAVTGQVIDITGQQGVITGFVFAVDDDNDRSDDQAIGNLQQLVVRIDTNPPPRVNGLRATDAANDLFDLSIDESSQIKVEWAPAGISEAQAAGWRQSDSAALSPWDSYVVTYYEVADTNGTAQANAVTATISRAVAAYSNTLNTWSFTNLVLSDLEFDAYYRIEIQGRDEAGNIGLATSVIGYTDRFIVTQGVARTSTDLYVRWTGPTNATVFRDYDILYIDSSAGFRNSTSNQWSLMTYTNRPTLIDAGGTNRVAPGYLTNNAYRFYRVARSGRWTTNNSARVASEEIYVTKSLDLKAGENWHSLFYVPDTATVHHVFGTNLLPRSDNSSFSTVISWYDSMRSVTCQVFLANDMTWQYLVGGSGGVPDSWEFPVNQGFNIEVPTATNLILIGRLPTAPMTNTIVAPPVSAAAMTDTGATYSVVSFALPVRTAIANLGFQDSGLAKDSRPPPFGSPDEIRILSNANGNGSINSPKARLFMKNDNNFYHWASPNTLANSFVVEPDDAVIIVRRNAGGFVWTNEVSSFYSPPTKNMTP